MFVSRGKDATRGVLVCGLGNGEIQIFDYPSMGPAGRIRLHSKRIMCMEVVNGRLWSGENRPGEEAPERRGVGMAHCPHCHTRIFSTQGHLT